MDKKKTPLSIKLSLAAVLFMIALPMLACMETVPPTPTADKPGTAQALSATEQALNLQATEKALSATQDAIKSESDMGQSQQKPEDGRVMFYVKNSSDYTICHIVFSPASVVEWREEDAVSVKILPNSSQSFPISPGIYDLLAVDCSYEVFVDEYDVEVPFITLWELTRFAEVEQNTQSQCGNGVCGSDENPASCPKDCMASECGNGHCESGEDALSCGYDCAFCPDGYCTGYENSGNCPQDCGSSSSSSNSTEPLCGNGVCGDFENPGNCPQDCGSGSNTKCGNGYCETGETAINCGYDCGFCPDGYCTGFENPDNCPQDCK